MEREHDRLKRITEDLEREHQALHERPYDPGAHEAHRDKLHHHIQDLHAHIERLKNHVERLKNNLKNKR